MPYFLKYRRDEDVNPMEEPFNSEKEALHRAFAFVTDLVPHVWIENEAGEVLVGEDAIHSACLKSISPAATPAAANDP